jgi:multidrug/hemolysin transport system ATP-binding protein
MKDIIKIEHLKKSYGEIKAVQDLSFRVGQGELFAFLGINGAGKSTTINIMCGQLSKDGGTVEISGLDLDNNLDQIKRSLGVVFQDSVLDSILSVRDNLKIRASLYGVKGEVFKNRLDELAKLLNFENILNRPIKKLSGGQRRRIDVARALLHRPKILILDEPTTGLDPQTRKLLWDVVGNLRKKEELTVFLTTHYMEEATDADYIIILDDGKICAEGTPLQLKNEYASDFITLYGVSESDVKVLGRKYSAVNDGWRIEVSDTSQATEMILANPECFKDYEINKGKMDDVFLSATGKKLVGGDE